MQSSWRGAGLQLVLRSMVIYVMVALIQGVSFQRSFEAVCTKQVSEDPGAVRETLPFWQSFL